MATKRCYSCDKTKDVAEFPINRKRGDGLGTLCKACKKVYNGSGFDPLAAHGRVRQRRAAVLKRRRLRVQVSPRLLGTL